MESQTIMACCLIITASLLWTAVALDSENTTCPIWTVPQVSNGSIVCQCGDDINGIVLCDSEKNIYVKELHCITHSKVYNRTVVSHCLYNLHIGKTGYAKLPRLEHTNDTAMCHFLEEITYSGDYLYYKHQTGPMCTSCEDGYAYPVYSYSMACVECKDYKYNWLKYIAVAYLPLTVFYIIVVLFRITVTSGAMNGYVLMCQLISAPANAILLSRISPYFKIYLAFLGVWNLDFFRGLYPPFCLHPKLTTLQTLMLDYVIAIYPLLLVIITYIFVKLHNRYSIVVRLWSPFYKCFAKIRNNLDVNRSLIGAFATFILLSYVKILNVSFYALSGLIYHDMHGKKMPKLFLYYDGTYEYFGKDHIPYALLAIFMLLVFNIFPLVLLCLYPCRCFQRCLNHLRIDVLTVRICMDTFIGCFRFEPRDYRYFAALYLFLRLFNISLLSLAEGTVYFQYTSFVFIIMIALVSYVKPYRSKVHTILDTVFFVQLTTLFVGLPAENFVRYVEKIYTIIWLCLYVPSALIPLAYGIGLLIYFTLPTKLLDKGKETAKQCKQVIRKDSLETDERPPYRLEHMDEYPPLLPIETKTYTE